MAIRFRRMNYCFVILLFIILSSNNIYSQVWQWSTTLDSIVSGETNGNPRAFLWVPENCKFVKGVVLGQHNMIEEGIFEHKDFRKAMADINFAIVWITPAYTQAFDFHKKDTAIFESLMKSLATISGYSEICNAPIVPIGHSALATFPWNFAAWAPHRTLAVVSVHGDAPQTNLTGYGRENIDWGERNIEGIPGLFIMGEYEWWDARMIPGLNYVSLHPNTPISFFADAGHGHFDYSDALVAYINSFIKKAV